MTDGQEKSGLLKFIAFGWKHRKHFKAYAIRNQARVAYTLINIQIAKLPLNDSLRYQRIREFNEGMLQYSMARWYAQMAMEGRGNDYWKKAFERFKKSNAIAKALKKKLNSGDRGPVVTNFTATHTDCTEIPYAQDVPLVPSITPIIMLQGSDREMGKQYARQVTQVFGDILLRRHIRDFTEQEMKELQRWEREHQKYTPEVLAFARGMAEGANEEGIPLTYHQALDLWVGHKAPARSPLNSEGGMSELPPIACTSIAAWGEATLDGELVAAATGDHDLSYQVTIVAFPENATPFIHTVFGATGTLPTVGPNWFFGHPGMNLNGVAYVHHGGGPKFLEPRESWGYGIRRTASVWHILRNAKTAREALEFEKSWPIGDVGNGDQATVGGFYADSHYGYIIEGRHEPMAIREAGLLGERDFLYANNSTMHPEAIKSEWMRVKRDQWTWDRMGGNRPVKPKGLTKSWSMIFKWFSGKMNMAELVSDGLMFAYWNSWNRNVFLRKMAEQEHGKIDEQTLCSIYRTFGELIDKPWAKAVRDYKKSGEWGPISAAHASNAFVAMMKPSEGHYSLCTGPAARGATPMSPDFAICIYDETNAFWDIKLGDSPVALRDNAVTTARALLENAKALRLNLDTHDSLKVCGALLEIMDGWLQEASAQLAGAEQNSGEDIYSLAKAVRAATRCQIRSRQVIQSVNIPKAFSYPR